MAAVMNEDLRDRREARAEATAGAQSMLDRYDLNQDGELDANELRNMQSKNPLVRMERRGTAILESNKESRHICLCCYKPGPLMELILYLVFMIVFTVYCMWPRSVFDFYFARILKETYVFENFGDNAEKDFDAIVNVDDFWEWAEGPLLGGLYFDEWYSGHDSTEKEKGNIVMNNRLLGGVRIRQVRVDRDRNCQIPKIMSKGIHHCYPTYTSASHSTAAYGSLEGLSDEYAKSFTYTQGPNSESYTTRLHPHSNSYNPGGGFFALLPNHDSDKATATLAALKAYKWLDASTRLVQIDMTFFNPNLNKFAVARFNLEFLESGGVVPSNSIKVLDLASNLYGPDDLNTLVNYAATGILTLFNVWYLFMELFELCKIGMKEYISDAWNYLELLNMVFLLASTLLSVSFLQMGHRLLQEYDITADKYIPFDDVAFYIAYSISFNGLNCILTYLKCFKFLGVNPKMGQMTRTIAIAADDLVVFLFAFAIVQFGFCVAFHVVLGSEMEAYRTIPDSLMSLIIILLGDFDYEEIQNSSIFGPVLFILYIIVVFFILFNMFLAIITDAYATMVQELDSLEGKQDDALTIEVERCWVSICAFLRCKKPDYRHFVLRREKQAKENSNNTVKLQSGNSSIEIPIVDLLEVAKQLKGAVENSSSLDAERKRKAAASARPPQPMKKTAASKGGSRLTPSQVRVQASSSSEESSEESDSD